MNEKISALLARRKMWAKLYPAWHIKKHFALMGVPTGNDWTVWVDEAQDIPLWLFDIASQSGRFTSDKPNFTMQDKQAGLDKLVRTCQHYNWSCLWSCLHPKPHEHVHNFRASGNGYDVCMDCGMSDVYYNWASKRS